MATKTEPQTHTPGPWSFHSNGRALFIKAVDERGGDRRIGQMVHYLSDVCGRLDDGETEANARIISRAPSLLETLELAERVIRHAAQESTGRVKAEIVGGWKYHADQIKAEIEKAKGK